MLQVESADLIAYGLIPEFIGRFPILVSLSALTEDQLVQVILDWRWIIMVEASMNFHFLFVETINGMTSCH